MPCLYFFVHVIFSPYFAVVFKSNIGSYLDFWVYEIVIKRKIELRLLDDNILKPHKFGLIGS